MTSSLSDRDQVLLRYVARFRQLSAAHIRTLVFHASPNDTPSNRTLKRLTEYNYLMRVERRLVGGTKGGSGQYVYQLGSKGHFLFFAERPNFRRTVDFHALGIADAYCLIANLQRQGRLSVIGLATEPDCWTRIAGVELKPDLRIDLSDTDLYWIEVDMATEGQKQLKGKLEAYCRAWDGADVNQWPQWPTVLWVAVDQARANEIAWLVKQMPKTAQPMFKVATLEGLAAVLCG